MKKQITITIYIADKLIEFRDKLGLPLGQLIELKIKGYGIKNIYTNKFIW